MGSERKCKSVKGEEIVLVFEAITYLIKMDYRIVDGKVLRRVFIYFWCQKRLAHSWISFN